MTVPLGAVRASLSIGDGPRMAIGSLGTVGPSLGVDVRSAATPTVLRGAANQATGQLAVTEQTAGALGGPAAGRFLVRLRLVALPDGSDGRGSAMSSAPWIVVTGGDLKFEVPEGLGATIVRGRPSNDGTFAEWIVSSPSTLPSTFEVRGSAGPDVPLPAGPLNGPRVDIGWPESLRTLGLSVEVIDPETRFLEIKGLDVVAYADGGSGQREVRNR